MEPLTKPLPKVKTKPRAVPSTGGPRALVRHIVELDAEGKPKDSCLCGHVWDRVFVPHGEEICQKCVDIARERSRKQ